MGTFIGEATLPFSLPLLSFFYYFFFGGGGGGGGEEEGASFRCFREKLRGQILSFKSYAHFRRISMPRDANRNSQRLSPFVKMVEKTGRALTSGCAG